MGIIVNKKELFHKLDLAPLHPRYELYITEWETDGEMALYIDTDEEYVVTIKLLFQFDIDTEDNLHIYTKGLDDSLLNELLAYFDEYNVQYETE